MQPFCQGGQSGGRAPSAARSSLSQLWRWGRPAADISQGPKTVSQYSPKGPVDLLRSGEYVAAFLQEGDPELRARPKSRVSGGRDPHASGGAGPPPAPVAPRPSGGRPLLPASRPPRDSGGSGAEQSSRLRVCAKKISNDFRRMGEPAQGREVA
eukprot:10686472-Alexandrium_andersonii.AAC.1